MGMPWRIAAAFTGDGISSCLRPFGRSGWVTTRDTACPEETRASSVGTANSGVPRKIMRMGKPRESFEGRLPTARRMPSCPTWQSCGLFPFAGPLELFDFAFDQVRSEEHTSEL